ncbi:MAG: hypothetical protein EB043_05360, partial [Actinobacteria bacterium]|nr:hypothetical protein [Actinomycetota bacterium]
AGYAFAIMHLLTHGFFKAGMFLGAGSVMHGMNDEVNMRKYGGLARVMPITAITFGLGYLAIIGVPPFAGFYSKDKIIETAFNAGGTKGILFGCAALLGAVITAFYPSEVSLWTRIARRDLLQDDANEFLFMRPGQRLTNLLVKIDRSVIDGVVRGIGSSAVGSARGLRTLQSGYVRNYALLILIGALLIMLAIWVVTL